jgi:DNA-directed RNA polymerase subunit alpha
MPIKKVACSINSATTPEGIEVDSVTIDIYSNGTIDPTIALGQAANKLIEKLAPIAQCSGETVSITTPGEAIKVPVQEEVVDKRVSLSIEELELSVRAYNCLKRANINSLGELLNLSYNELMNIKNFGRKSADEVLERLHAMGLHLTDETGATIGSSGSDFELQPQGAFSQGPAIQTPAPSGELFPN